jgi:hypothetical protein
LKRAEVRAARGIGDDNLAIDERARVQGIAGAYQLGKRRAEVVEVPAEEVHCGWVEYAVEEEQRAVEASGLQFRHAPLTDFSAPPPDEIAAAIAELDKAVEHGAPVRAREVATSNRLTVSATRRTLAARMQTNGGGSGMPDQVLELRLELDFATDSDAEELEQSTVRLYRRLRESQVESVARAPGGTAPDGTRAVDPASIGVLLVTLVKSAPGLKSLVTTVWQAMPRDQPRKVKLKIGTDTLELSNASAEQQQQLIDSWVARHAA